MGAVMPAVFTARLPILEWGVASSAHPGQRESGDLHIVQEFPAGCLAGAVDGLGHGAEAATAARRAVATLAAGCDDTVMALVRRCHRELAGTRGVTMSLAAFNATDDTMTWLAIGNVEGVLLRANPRRGRPRETILMRAGVVGLDLPRLQASVTTISAGDVVVLATDGVRRDFVEVLHPADQPQALAERVLRFHAKGTDDALVLVARYRGSEGPP
jgi:negative regulator of sigma-B (phosphoserine phosphatase)